MRPWPFAWCVLVLGCSVDPGANAAYRHDDCKDSEYAYLSFCVPKADAGAAGKDAGDLPDGGEPDAAPAPCTPRHEEGCWPYPESISLSLQSPCRQGTHVCDENGHWGECMGAMGPHQEVCDGKDNDCDGTVDEAQLQKACPLPESVLGVCGKSGQAFCSGGKELCVATTGPVAESCNGEDDDCDGQTDEGLDVACYTAGDQCQPNATGGYDCVPASTCKPGTLRCVDGSMQTECADQVGPQAERATVGGEAPLDEDCDQKIDEGFACQNGQEYPCYTGPAATRGHAPCKDGKITCNNGLLSACQNERTPQPETCANIGVDDDCDGVQDDVPDRGTSCSDESTALGVCKATATWACASGKSVCVDGAKQTEICDGKDNDCNGHVDDGFDLDNDVNNCGTCNNRCGTGLTCCGGACVNIASSNTNCNGCGKMCDANFTCCSGTCVDTRSDSKNCGYCAHSCLLPPCNNGACL